MTRRHFRRVLTCTVWLWLAPAAQLTAQSADSAYARAHYVQRVLQMPMRDGARLLPDDAWWRATVAHPNYDAFGRARAIAPRLAAVSHPMLVIGGWYDTENLYGTLAAYRALRGRGNVTLAMGPFGHRGWRARDVTHTVHGDLYFGHSLETALQRDVALGAGRTLAFAETRGRAPTLRSFAGFVSDPCTPVPSRCGGPTAEDGSPLLYMSGDQRCLEGQSDVAAFQLGGSPSTLP